MSVSLLLTPAQRRQRTVALAVVVTAYMLSFFQRFAPAGIAQDLASAFQTSAASLGVLAATYFYVYTVMQIPTGILVDTLGPRRILVLGGIIGGLGSLLFGLAPDLSLALAGRTLVGLGVSVTFIAMLKIIAVWYEESRFATVVGIALLLGNLGSVIAGAPLALMAQGIGWRMVFVGIAGISLLLGLGCWLVVRDRPPRADGQASATTPVRVHFDRTVIFNALLAIVRNRTTWPLAVVMLGICGAFFTFAGLWATPYLMQVHGMSRNLAANHLSVYFAGFALGALFLGSLSDRMKRRKPVLIACTHANAVLWLLWYAAIPLTPWLGYSLFALMGITTASFTLTWACAKEVNPPLLSGMSTSVVNMGGFLAAAILQPLVGWVIDQHWQGGMTASGTRLYTPDDFSAGILLLAVMAWLGALASWWIRETGCRNIWAELDATQTGRTSQQAGS